MIYLGYSRLSSSYHRHLDLFPLLGLNGRHEPTQAPLDRELILALLLERSLVLPQSLKELLLIAQFLVSDDDGQ